MDDKRYIKIAQELNLFTQGQSAGVVYWKPAGFELYEKLKIFIRQHHKSRGYKEVKSPCISVSSVFEQSGHSEKYASNMFFIQQDKLDSAEGEPSKSPQYALRPMSCPNHILLYQSEGRSYKQLPLALFEFGEVFRNEPSGSLQTLFRQRQFCQDDSHVFVAPESLVDSIGQYLSMAATVYQELGFKKIQYAISLRPEQRFGSEQDWDKAEDALRQACRSNGLDYQELPGEGAFYGPKIEIKVQDKLGKYWQLGTLQLDYVLPQRFELSYVREDNSLGTPVLLHHAVLGSLERMIGVLLESFGKQLPEFLHPYPEVIVSVSQKSLYYAQELQNKHLRAAVLDQSDETLGKKIAAWSEKGVLRLYVVGEAEAQQYAQSGVMSAQLRQGRQNSKIEFPSCAV